MNAKNLYAMDYADLYQYPDKHDAFDAQLPILMDSQYQIRHKAKSKTIQESMISKPLNHAPVFDVHMPIQQSHRKGIEE